MRQLRNRGQTFRHVIERSLSPRWHASAIDPSDIPDIAGLSAYRRGRTHHISGVSASGDRLVIRLAQPDAALPQRLSLKFFCAVPDNAAVREDDTLPMAGPYYVSSYSKGKEVVLSRNPNYRGHRPARLNTIDITFGERPSTSIARVIQGAQDYYVAPAFSLDVMSPAEEARLRTRYGPGAAQQRFFENPSTSVMYLAFNTARGPFANGRLRRAVNFAIDRNAIVAEQGGQGPSRPTDQYLPAGLPGFRDTGTYPPGGDLPRALRLAGRRHHRAILITPDFPPFPQRAQIVQSNLAKIGIDVHIEPLSVAQMFKHVSDPQAGWDLAAVGWTPDFPDPSNVLNPLLRGTPAHNKDSANFARFDDPAYNRRLDAAARLTGPARSTTYAKLDADLISKAAPMAALGVWLNRDLFSARIGCQIYQPIYGIDLAALCLRKA